MKFRVLLDQPLRFHRRVDLRRRDARVAEHLLNGAEIRTTRQQMRRE